MVNSLDFGMGSTIQVSMHFDWLHLPWACSHWKREGQGYLTSCIVVRGTRSGKSFPSLPQAGDNKGLSAAHIGNIRKIATEKAVCPFNACKTFLVWVQWKGMQLLHRTEKKKMHPVPLYSGEIFLPASLQLEKNGTFCVSLCDSKVSVEGMESFLLFSSCWRRGLRLRKIFSPTHQCSTCILHWTVGVHICEALTLKASKHWECIKLQYLT